MLIENSSITNVNLQENFIFSRPRYIRAYVRVCASNVFLKCLSMEYTRNFWMPLWVVKRSGIYSKKKFFCYHQNVRVCMAVCVCVAGVWLESQVWNMQEIYLLTYPHLYS